MSGWIARMWKSKGHASLSWTFGDRLLVKCHGHIIEGSNSVYILPPSFKFHVKGRAVILTASGDHSVRWWAQKPKNMGYMPESPLYFQGHFHGTKPMFGYQRPQSE